MKNILLLSFLLTTINLHGQKFITGFVFDSMNNPLPWSANIFLYGDSTFVSNNSKELDRPDSIWIRPVYYSAYSDNTGAFHLLVDEGQVLI